MKSKKISITLITCLLLTSLVFSGTAYAQDEDLPDPGITPDSPFYFFDNLGKNVVLFFAFGPEAKVKKALEYAEERLAEAQVMAAKNRTRELERATEGFDKFAAMANEKVEEAKQRGTSDNVSERVALATAKHLSILDRIKDRAPEKAKEAIARAREVSKNGQINALRALAKKNPERALDITSATIANRLERARVRATDNVTTDNVTTDNVTADVAEALDYAERIAELEDELAAIAQEKGIDITQITQRLTQSTSNRLEVLARVYDKVPEQAKPAIARAIENSVNKYERAVDKLKEKNALGKIPEGAPVPQKIREEIKERLKQRVLNRAQLSDNVSDNVTISLRVQAEAKERIQEKVREQISNLRPEKPEPALSANKTRERDGDSNSAMPKRSPGSLSD